MKYLRRNAAMFSVLALTCIAPFVSAADGPREASLRSIMKQMDRDTLRAVSALMTDDWHALDRAASLIADHPRPPLPERVRILSALGSRAADFKNLDGVVHDAARALAEAARAADGRAAADKMSAMLSGCVACHTAFREDVLKLRENQAERN